MTGSLGALLKEISEINTNSEISHKLEQCSDILVNLDNFLKETASGQSSLREKIFNDTFKEPWEEIYGKGLSNFLLPTVMMSGKVEGEFYQLMAEMVKAKNIMEIGMYTGYTAVTFAESKYCQEVIALDREPYLEQFVKSRIKGSEVENKIRIIIGDAMESLERLKNENKKFALIFLDADKHNYINHYKFIMDDGIILCDNVIWGAGTFFEYLEMGEQLKEFTLFVKSDKRVRHTLENNLFILLF